MGGWEEGKGGRRGALTCLSTTSVSVFVMEVQVNQLSLWRALQCQGVSKRRMRQKVDISIRGGGGADLESEMRSALNVRRTLGHVVTGAEQQAAQTSHPEPPLPPSLLCSSSDGPGPSVM